MLVPFHGRCSRNLDPTPNGSMNLYITCISQSVRIYEPLLRPRYVYMYIYYIYIYILLHGPFGAVGAVQELGSDLGSFRPKGLE